jgi:hypothetical protein
MAICAISASATHLARLHGFRGTEPAELSVFPVFPAVVFGSVSGVMAAPQEEGTATQQSTIFTKSQY